MSLPVWDREKLLCLSLCFFLCLYNQNHLWKFQIVQLQDEGVSVRLGPYRTLEQTHIDVSYKWEINFVLWSHWDLGVGMLFKHNTAYPAEKAMAPHSSVLAWRIPGTGEPGGLQSMGSQSQTRPKRLSSRSSSSLSWLTPTIFKAHSSVNPKFCLNLNR